MKYPPTTVTGIEWPLSRKIGIKWLLMKACELLLLFVVLITLLVGNAMHYTVFHHLEHIANDMLKIIIGVWLFKINNNLKGAVKA